MQDKILLGFLMAGSQTGYDIKKNMEQSTDFFFNTSAGSIYPAFRKLLKEELATREECIEGGRAKNIYTITQKGKDAFLAWLDQDLPIGKVKQEALLRTFFFSYLTPDQRTGKIEAYIDELKERQSELIGLQNMIENLKIDRFRSATLQYGIDLYGFSIQWHHRFLEELDKAGPPLKT